LASDYVPKALQKQDLWLLPSKARVAVYSKHTNCCKICDNLYAFVTYKNSSLFIFEQSLEVWDFSYVATALPFLILFANNKVQKYFITYFFLFPIGTQYIPEVGL
jgi:hypothetical protein